MNTTNPVNRTRSTTPPLMSAAVMMANIIWKIMMARGDTATCPNPGKARPKCSSPARWRFPSRPPPMSLPKARLKPNTAQITVTMPMQTKLSIMTERTFLDRTMPP